MAAPTARGRTVSGTVSLPSRGAFHLSLTVLVRYRSQESIQDWRVVPPGSDRVSRARPYSGAGPLPGRGFAYGALTLCGRPSQAVPLPTPGRAGPRQGPHGRSYNPGGAKAAARVRSPVCPRPPFARRYSGDLGIDFFSSGYLDVSVPRVVLPRPMDSGGGWQARACRVRPFGDPRVEGCVPLTADYRSLPRPSSASCAKASAVRPTYLPALPARAPHEIMMLW